MNTTDLSENIERCMTTGYKECPYYDGEMVDGKCRECGWEILMEYPPMEE